MWLYEFSGDEKTVYCSGVIHIRFNKKTKFLDSYVFIAGNNFSTELGAINNVYINPDRNYIYTLKELKTNEINKLKINFKRF